MANTLTAQQPEEIASLNVKRAKRFLSKLKDSPFVTAVFEPDGKVRIYLKEVTPAELREIKEALDEAIELEEE